MSDNDKFRQKILQEVANQRALRQKEVPSSQRAKLLGSFLKACLENNNQSEGDFARQLQIPPELASMVLQGNVPGWMFSEEMLNRMAQAVSYDANILRVMLSRQLNVSSNKEDMDDDFASSSEA